MPLSNLEREAIERALLRRCRESHPIPKMQTVHYPWHGEDGCADSDLIALRFTEEVQWRGPVRDLGMSMQIILPLPEELATPASRTAPAVSLTDALKKVQLNLETFVMDGRKYRLYVGHHDTLMPDDGLANIYRDAKILTRTVYIAEIR